MKRKILTFAALMLGSASLLLGTAPAGVKAEENTEGASEIEYDEASVHLADYTELEGVPTAEELGELPLYSPAAYGMRRQQSYCYLAIFVEFDDEELTDLHLDSEETVANAESFFNDTTGTVMITAFAGSMLPVTSLKTYVEKYSYGKCTVDADIFPKDGTGKVVSCHLASRKSYMPYNAASNPAGYTNSAVAERNLIREIMSQVRPQLEEYYSADELDVNGDGYIDAISFFVEGTPALSGDGVAWGDLLWSHKTTNNSETVQGKTIGSYNLINTYAAEDADGRPCAGGMFSSNRPSYGTIIHEYMHTLGLPDLYRYYDSEGAPVGFYDLMAGTNSVNPQGILTYMLSDYALAWHNPLETVNTSTENIMLSRAQYANPAEKCAVKVCSPYNQEEFFVIEYYAEHTSPVTTDSGLIVYRVNEEYRNNGNAAGNYQGGDDLVYIFRPGETALKAGKGDLSLATLNMTRKSYGKPLGTEADGFDASTIYFSDGENSGITVEVVAQTDSSVTFNLTVPQANGSGTREDPYQIRTPQEFISILSGNRGKYYILMNDLDFKDVGGYTGIEYFSGYLEGNNHCIKNVTVTGSGLFDMVGYDYSITSAIRNLTLENITVLQGDRVNHVGPLASSVNKAVIENVVVKSGNVTGGNSGDYAVWGSFMGAGGFVGTACEDAVITNCSTYAEVKAGLNVGGFVGLNQNAVYRNCLAAGHLSNGQGAFAGSVLGGFIGRQYNASGSTYHTPENVRYDTAKTGASSAVGYTEGGFDASGIAGVTETPAETPTETPAETPAETPTETPAETPTETPTQDGKEKFASYEGYDFYRDKSGNITCFGQSGEPVIDDFKCDGTYTYYFQADGTAMKNRLTYHPDGKHIIYFDEYGHEVFDNFAYVKQSIAGGPVDDMCYFNTYGYMYVDVLTYDITGTYLYYANPYGVMERNGWFRFSDDGIGYANELGILTVSQFTYDRWGRTVYAQADGHLAMGWISDGVYWYHMDADDGHLLGTIPVQ